MMAFVYYKTSSTHAFNQIYNDLRKKYRSSIVLKLKQEQMILLLPTVLINVALHGRLLSARLTYPNFNMLVDSISMNLINIFATFHQSWQLKSNQLIYELSRIFDIQRSLQNLTVARPASWYSFGCYWLSSFEIRWHIRYIESFTKNCYWFVDMLCFLFFALCLCR